MESLVEAQMHALPEMWGLQIRRQLYQEPSLEYELEHAVFIMLIHKHITIVFTRFNQFVYISYGSAPGPKTKCGFRFAKSKIVTAKTPFAQANQLRVYWFT